MLDQGDAEFLAEGEADFRKDAPASAIFLKNGRPYVAGERLVQKDLARMLRIIAKDGADGFYRGEPARLIVEASRKGRAYFPRPTLSATVPSNASRWNAIIAGIA